MAHILMPQKLARELKSMDPLQGPGPQLGELLQDATVWEAIFLETAIYKPQDTGPKSPYQCSLHIKTPPWLD